MKNVFLALLFPTAVALAAEPPQPKFRVQEIDAAVSIGYGIAIADVDGEIGRAHV